MLIKIAPGWEIPERQATPETNYWNRREVLKAAGALGLSAGQIAAAGQQTFKFEPPTNLTPTPELAATGFNNFYEFDPQDKQAVKDKVGAFVIKPWQFEVTGLVRKPRTFDLDDVLRTFPTEQRLYRFRCVEAWAMQVPWTGFPFANLIKAVEPKPQARWVRFFSASKPKEMPGMARTPWYPWPYFEALRLDEAMNPLTLVVTGLYGKPLPKQNGAPVRMIVPWKYGFKSPKSIVRIEFVEERPTTFWHKFQPLEYGFFSNVDPEKPHPRWSQASEKVIPTMERRPTLIYNGYGKYVSRMYDGAEY